MGLRIAIQPDEVVHPHGKRQSFSERWLELARDRGIEIVLVDAFAHDVISQISTCDAFMWHYPASAHPRVYARRLFYAIEKGLGMPVFPSLSSSWYYEDKIGQDYFLLAAGIPTPATHVFWTRQDAVHFCNTTGYPFVLKLACGQRSSNVRLVRTPDEALFYVDELFGHGVSSLGYRPAPRGRLMLRRLRAASGILVGRNPYGPTAEAELQHGYFYAQEFLPDNAFEISVIVIGKRAFACRRFVLPGDFRTRGSSGRMDWTPNAICEDTLRLAYRVARKLGAQTVGVDILQRGVEPVVVELTVNYASWVVRACPGHWILDGEPESGKLTWADGSVRAADVIMEDFLAEIFQPKCVMADRTPRVSRKVQ